MNCRDDITMNDVLRYLMRYNVRSVEINFDKDTATFTERFGSVSTWKDLSVLLQSGEDDGV